MQLVLSQQMPGTHLHLGGEWQLWISNFAKGCERQTEIWTLNLRIESQVNEPLYHFTTPKLSSFNYF